MISMFKIILLGIMGIYLSFGHWNASAKKAILSNTLIKIGPQCERVSSGMLG